jgi:restriction endonuclease S subunit
MKTQPLGDVADIRMGATLRGRDATRPDPHGSYRFLRIGDISQDGVLQSKEFLRIKPNRPIRQELWVRPGDVLFPNRGVRSTAIAFTVDQPRIIVGPQFFIVRPRPKILLPEYAAWFLRSEAAAAHFDSRRKGTHVQIIQRKDLAELQIPLAPLATQEKIVSVAALARSERELTQRLLDCRWRLANEQLVRLARSHAGREMSHA